MTVTSDIEDGLNATDMRTRLQALDRLAHSPLSMIKPSRGIINALFCMPTLPAQNEITKLTILLNYAALDKKGFGQHFRLFSFLESVAKDPGMDARVRISAFNGLNRLAYNEVCDTALVRAAQLDIFAKSISRSDLTPVQTSNPTMPDVK